MICGRPTKKGTPCLAVLHPWQVACTNHATPAEQELAYQILKAQQKARR